MKTKVASPLDFQPTEHQIQDAIIGYLWAKGYYVQRMNAGQMRVKKFRRDSVTGVMRQADSVVKLAAPGTPDILAIKNGRATWVEVKRPGNKPTLLQQMKMDELRRYGCVCIVATGAEDLIKAGL